MIFAFICAAGNAGQMASRLRHVTKDDRNCYRNKDVNNGDADFPERITQDSGQVPETGAVPEAAVHETYSRCENNRSACCLIVTRLCSGGKKFV